MLALPEFENKILEDLKKEYLTVKRKKDLIYIGTGITNVELPIEVIYREYIASKDYREVFMTYNKIIKEILEQYNFSIDYNNVFPILKYNTFGSSNNNKNLSFYKEDAFEDISTFYVSDMNEVFRFVLRTDDVDFNKLKKRAWENLNKLTNVLVKMDKSLDIYTLRFTTYFNATLLLSSELQKQILKKVGQDYLFTISSATTLVIAKYKHEYIRILESLIQIDNDPNKISDKVYRCTEGVYQIVS